MVVWWFIKNFKIELLYDPAVPLWVFSQRKQNTKLKRCLQPHVPCRITYNSQDREKTCVPWWLNGQRKCEICIYWMGQKLSLFCFFLFFRFHVYVLAYGICFSPSDIFHSVWQTPGPSTSLQITQFHFFLWLSNIPLYICVTSSLSIHLSMDT